MDRKNFIRTTGISLTALLTRDSLFVNKPGGSPVNFPDEVTAIVNNQLINLKSNGKESWQYKQLQVGLHHHGENIVIDLQAPQVSLSAVTLYWNRKGHSFSSILNDEWERTYGDASWHKPAETEILPWYFMEYNGSATSGFGVKTGAASFCSWRINNNQLSLTMDTRNGGSGVQLGERKLHVAELVTIKNHPGESPFQALRRFTKIMCDKARMPKEPVYGINDWYFTYRRFNL